VVPAADLDAEIEKFTGAIVARSAATIRVGKGTFYQQIDSPLPSAYDAASEAMARNLLLEDAAEGMDAFIEKRAAHWKGR
jgi:enoyl-CoA hydratase/carnithine racemase